MSDLNSSVSVIENVLTREIQGETVLLNLDNETYYGLDDVSTRFWMAINSSQDLRQALDHIVGEFDVEETVAQTDLLRLVDDLAAHGLISVHAPGE